MGGLLLAVGIGVALAWTALAVRLIVLARGPWFRLLGPDAPRPTGDDWPTVAAIVPARNEEDHIAGTVAALGRQDYPNLVITLVDDESTDGTLAIMRRIEAEPVPGCPAIAVVAGTTRPPGWVGKTWAVHQAARSATAEWLWFVDADMGLDPGALALAMAEAQRCRADLVSFLPGVHCETFWQRTIAASLLHILAHLFPLNRVNDPLRPEALAAGGFLLVRRSVYEAAGGHEAVRHAIVEDIELARSVKRAGGRLAVRLAPQLAWTHMYGSFGAIWQGLRKNAYAGMDYQPHKFVVGAMVALGLAWTPLVLLGAGAWRGSTGFLAVGLWGLLAQVVATIPNLVFVGAGVPYALALPLGITAYVAIATASAWHYHRGHVVWKGRSIDAATLLPSNIAAETSERPAENRGQTEARRR